MVLDYEEKNAYRYKVLRDGIAVERGWTYDFERRAAEIQSWMHGKGRIEVKRVGGKVSVKKAQEWERKCHK